MVEPPNARENIERAVIKIHLFFLGSISCCHTGYQDYAMCPLGYGHINRLYELKLQSVLVEENLFVFRIETDLPTLKEISTRGLAPLLDLAR
jgi:hypothetical protein